MDLMMNNNKDNNNLKNIKILGNLTIINIYYECKWHLISCKWVGNVKISWKWVENKLKVSWK